MPKKIKIMHIINNLQVGGAEKMLVLLLNNLAKRPDIEIYLVSLEGSGHLANELSNKIHIKEFKYRLFFAPLLNKLDLNFRFGLFNYVLNIKPDIIHGHLFKGEDFAKVLGALTKTPVVTTSHDMLIWPGRKVKFLNKYLNKAIAVSGIVAKHLKKAYELDDDKIEVIPNAIDVELFKKGRKKFNQDRPVFLYIGRLLKSKGIDNAMKGLARLRDEYPEMEFLVYGKEVFKSYRDYLDKLVAKNNWDFVKFMGKTDDVPAALKAGDIFISPSQSEGFGISVLEAAAASKPIVATRTGAIPEMLVDGKNGYFVDWASPVQIFNACKKILDNRLVDSMGKESVKIASRSFNIDKVIKNHLELYSELCDYRIKL